MLRDRLNATAGANSGGGSAGTCELPAMLDVQAVADLLDCSTRHVYRLSDMGRMPRPVKLGALSRWSKATTLDWIAHGCPNCRGDGEE